MWLVQPVPASFMLAIQLLCCLCTLHFHSVHLLGKVLIVTFTLRHFSGKFTFILYLNRHWWRLRMCVIARKNKDMLSRIFGILESLDQHNLNKFFVGKMRDLAGICFLCCVLCFTEKLCYEGGMLHFPIRGFQSLSVLEVPLMACFSKLPLHLLPVFNRSLLPFLGIF